VHLIKVWQHNSMQFSLDVLILMSLPVTFCSYVLCSLEALVSARGLRGKAPDSLLFRNKQQHCNIAGC
jgi:hypothetical protein